MGETTFEVCCGPGGMAQGFSKYFDIAHAVDIEPVVVSTYGANHPETDVQRKDIRLLSGVTGDYDGITGVIGGPPCQGSSIINTKRNEPDARNSLMGEYREDDPRNELMGEFMRLVDEIRPRFFVMENVPGVSKERKAEVVRLGKASGFEVVSTYVHAENHGAAQTRKRWIVVGIKGKRWQEPAPQPAKTVRQAFAGVGSWGAMQSRPDTLERLSHAVPGKWTGITGKFRSMTRLEWDKPAPAVVNLTKIYMRHPDENRNITLAEAAALQGFPPDYIWYGNNSERGQMIANAMPSELAQSIAGSVTER